LTITGRNFVGDIASDTMIGFDTNAPVVPDTVQNTTIRVTVPGTLRAGVRIVRVIRNVRFGTPADPHAGSASAPAQFLLMPEITNVSPVAGTVGSPVTISVKPDVGRMQRAALYIGDFAIELDARPPSAPATSSSLEFPIPTNFPYTSPPTALPLRLEVDGAQSPLTLDETQGSPTFGQFLPQALVTGP